MNKKQLISLWVGIVIIVLMGLFPPWFFMTVSSRSGMGYRRATNYKFITPRPRSGNIEAEIDFSLLCIQWVIVAAITTGLVVTFKDKKPKDEQSNK